MFTNVACITRIQLYSSQAKPTPWTNKYESDLLLVEKPPSIRAHLKIETVQL